VVQQSWPSPAHNGRAVTEAELEALHAWETLDGIAGDPTDDPVVSAGVGLTALVRAEAYGHVRGQTWYSGTTPVSLDVAPNASGQTRVDRVVLRLDRATWTVRAVVKEGTPGSGAPALTRNGFGSGVYEVPLARITVTNGATAVTVDREELYIGARTRPCTSKTRPPAPARGEQCFEVDTGDLRMWNGSRWVILYSRSGTVVCDAPNDAWEIASQSVLQVWGAIACLRLGTFRRKAGTLDADTPSRLPVLIPEKYRYADRDLQIAVYVSGARTGRAILYSDADDKRGQLWLTNKQEIKTGESVIPTSGQCWVVE
jgi:hypothetical protein